MKPDSTRLARKGVWLAVGVGFGVLDGIGVVVALGVRLAAAVAVAEMPETCTVALLVEMARLVVTTGAGVALAGVAVRSGAQAAAHSARQRHAMAVRCARGWGLRG